MDEREKLRPDNRGGSIRRERPQAPQQRPASSRPRTGTTADQARARRERLGAERAAAAELQPEEASEEQAPATSEASYPPARKTRSGSAATNTRTSGRRQRKKRPHRIYNTNFGFKFLIMLAVVATVLLSMAIFFKVKHIHVILKGAADPFTVTESELGPEEAPTADSSRHSYYTREEIIEAAGISIDDNLLSLSKAGIASKIHAAFPYVDEVIVQKKLPGSVYITITEFTVTYGIRDETGSWWLISQEGRALEPADEQTVAGHILINGVSIRTPEVGQVIEPVTSEGADLTELSAKRSAILALLPELERMSYAKKLVSIDLSSSFDIILWYGSQYEIKLGNTEQLTYKLQTLDAVLNRLGPDESGTIDLTFTEDPDVHFLPFG